MSRLSHRATVEGQGAVILLNMLTAALLLLQGSPYAPTHNPSLPAVIARISEDHLRDDLKFISSDELKGRGTPSEGLDKAADFIAAEFKADGLVPLGDGGYFQTTTREFRTHFNGRVTGRTQNVIGMLPGSDPALKNTYIIVTAHYDHLGMNPKKEGDQIYNGANDDGSGTVTVMELAHAFAKASPRPKRSIVFMTFFGEELGLLGSRYYGEHPAVPLAQTVAQINIEQVGRSDGDGADQRGKATLTGYDYTDLQYLFEQSATAVGFKMYKHPTYSDRYFAFSDNQSLADLGVPAITFGTAFEFPDYHDVGDTWDKVDFPNLVKVNQLLVHAVFDLADSKHTTEWSAGNERTRKYVEAWKKLHGG